MGVSRPDPAGRASGAGEEAGAAGFAFDGARATPYSTATSR